MRIIRRPKELQGLVGRWKRAGKSIGFIPTMGALHEGHLSLVRRARRENQMVVVSIFVNPKQFGPREDYGRYPRPFSKDKAVLMKAKVDVLFCPAARALYPRDFQTTVSMGRLARNLCGRFRPGHFEGVATIVTKLFILTAPDRAYFGAKDYQQALVIRRLAEDLNFPVRIRILPTVRETGGLALSSRNRYLSKAERARALALPRTLRWLRDEIAGGRGDLSRLRREARRRLGKSVDKIDYLEIVDANTLVSLRSPRHTMVAAAACYVGKTRLIDNVKITP